MATTNFSMMARGAKDAHGTRRNHRGTTRGARMLSVRRDNDDPGNMAVSPISPRLLLLLLLLLLLGILLTAAAVLGIFKILVS